MKNVKSIVKTLLFSAFMAVVVSTAGDTINPIKNPSENIISVCSEECPDVEVYETGY